LFSLFTTWFPVVVSQNKKVFPPTRVQRCTIHKTANVLDKMPKSVQPQAKRMLHQHISELIKGVRFIDGAIEQSADELRSTTTKSRGTHTEIVA
jgi:hypothetical protein